MHKFIIAFFICCLLGAAFTSQPAGHVWFSDKLIIEGKKQLDLGLFNSPVYGISSHMALDRLAGEASLDYQLDIAGVRLLIMYVNTPDDKKHEFLVNAFWGLFPDLCDKLLGTRVFHPIFIETPIVPLSRGATDLLEELAVISYTIKF